MGLWRGSSSGLSQEYPGLVLARVLHRRDDARLATQGLPEHVEYVVVGVLPVGLGDGGVRLVEARIELYGALEMPDCAYGIDRRASKHEGPAAQEGIVGRDVAGIPAGDGDLLAGGELHAKRLDDARGHPILQIEELGE